MTDKRVNPAVEPEWFRNRHQPSAWLGNDGFIWIPHATKLGLSSKEALTYSTMQVRTGDRPLFCEFTVAQVAERTQVQPRTATKYLKGLAAKGMAENLGDGIWRLVPPWEAEPDDEERPL